MALTLSKRMDIVEQKLAGLESLPERMTALESQFLQLLGEMRAEFSAVRSELRAGVDDAKDTLRKEIRAGDEETRRVLREEIGDLRTHMHVLHEDLIARLALIQEGQKPSRRKR